MDKLISQQAAIDALCKSECGWNNAECRHKDGTDFCVTCDNVKIIKSLPSIQPEVIRCKDCKHSRFFDPCFYCYEMGGEIIVPENGFCFKAERREVSRNDRQYHSNHHTPAHVGILFWKVG